MSETLKVCCICGERFFGWGNDPWPVNMDKDAVRCDKCDNSVVLEARLEEMRNAG